MSESIWTSAAIGGELKRTDIDALVKAIEDTGLLAEEFADNRAIHKALLTHASVPEAAIFEGECNDGYVGSLPEICTSLGLTVRVALGPNESSGGATITLHTPVWPEGRTVGRTADDEPSIAYSDLELQLEAGISSLRQVKDHLSMFLPQGMPPLEITGLSPERAPSALRERHGLACPRCGADGTMRVEARYWVSLDGHGIEMCGEPHDAAWDSTSRCRCESECCDWEGTTAEAAHVPRPVPAPT